MAKGLRSKTQRANRAIKRERNAVKERAKLEKIVEIAKEAAAEQQSKEIYTVIGPTSGVDTDEKMVVDGSEVTSSPTVEAEIENMPIGVGPKTKHGNYPAWMNGRAIKKAKLAAKKKRQQQKRKQRSGSKPWKR